LISVSAVGREITATPRRSRLFTPTRLHFEYGQGVELDFWNSDFFA